MNSKLLLPVLLLFCACGGNTPLGHYWDDWDFSTSDSIDPYRETQKRFAGYVELLEQTDTATAGASIRKFLNKAKADTVSYYVFSDLFLSAFYPRVSPYWNEDLLQIYLRKVIADGIATGYMNFDEEDLLRRSALNREGSVAEDAPVSFPGGDSEGLHSIAARSPRTVLLLIAEPQCSSCIEMMKRVEDHADGGEALLAVISRRPAQAVEFLQKKLSDRWLIGIATPEFEQLWDFAQAPVAYTLSASAEVLSVAAE